MDAYQVDPGSFTPLYEQVRLTLMERIRSGEWDDGSPLPSEPKLAEVFGVSRITVRQAVSAIAREGYLVRQQGRGTFVRRREGYHLLGGVHSFVKNAEVMGKTARTEVIRERWVPAVKRIAARLQIAPGERYLYIRLLRYLDEELVGWQVIHVSPLIADLVDMDALKRKQGLNPLLVVKGKWVAETRLEQGARLAGKLDRELLGCPPATPILFSNYTEYAEGGTVYSHSEVAFRGDRFKWVFKVAGA